MRRPLLLAALAASNIAVAVFFQWYVIVKLGPGIATDALFAGMTVPQLVVAVASGSLTQVLVPLLGGEAPERLRHDAWAFFLLVGGLFCAVGVVLYGTAGVWVPLTVPGFSDTGKALTVSLTRIQLVGMVFTALAGVQAAVYHARQRFVWVDFAQLLTGLGALLALVLLLPSYGVVAAAWIATVRFAAYVVLQMPALGAFSRPDLRSPSIDAAWRRIKPLLLGTTYYKTDPLVDRFLLSSAAHGSLSLFYLAQQIYGAVSTVMTKAIVAPLVPRLSVLHKAGDEAGFRHAWRRGFVETALLALACIAVALLAGRPLLSALVGHGAVTGENVDALWAIMVALGGMFVGGALGALTASTFYAQGNTRLPTRIGVVSYTIYIPVKVLCFQLGGVLALAAAASAYYLANLAIQWYCLERTEWPAAARSPTCR